MDSGRWERVKELFESALPLEPDARREFVAQHAHDDESVESEVLSLLAAHQDAGDFMERRNGDLFSPGSYPAEPALTFSPNELIAERFRVVRFIHHGGMGEVYEAEDLELNEHVALKTIRSKVASDPHTLARFRQEVQLARRVAHPNVCHMYDVERHQPEDTLKPEVVFLTMELLEGETLADRLAWQGKMSCQEALPIVRQLGEALSAAHQAGVLHCDFKPSNVMLVREKRLEAMPVNSSESTQAPGSTRPDSTSPLGLRAVITDFGLARALLPTVTRAGEQSAHAGQWEGTLAYMAPEQLEGRECTPATDVYALGLVIYEMLTGHRAFSEARTWEEACTRLTEPSPSPRVYLPELDAPWERAILRCLGADPAARFQSPRFLVQELSHEFATAVVVPPSKIDHRRQAIQPAFRPKIRTRDALAALAVLALVVAGLATWAHLTTPPPGIRSLAVLPLENVSGDPGQDYFAKAVTDRLITNLTRISALRVISEQFEIQYTGRQGRKPLAEVARALNVDAVVQGTVLKSGDRIRISAQLIDARTDGHVFWADHYDRDLRDILTLQSEVARAIAEEIQIKLTAQEQSRLNAKRLISTEAYEAYLKGRYEWTNDTEYDWRQARDSFEKAIATDPKFAAAYSGLADCYWATDELPPSVAMPEAKKYALKALEVDPGLADAYTSLGAVQLYGYWNWTEAERDFKHALELDPDNGEAHRRYATYLSWMGKPDEALEESRKAERLDPAFFLDSRNTVGWVLYYTHRFDQALEQCREVIDLEPGSPSAHQCLGESYLATKEYDKGIEESRKAADLSHNQLNMTATLARAYGLVGNEAQADKILDQLLERAKHSYVAPSLIAQIYLAMGDKKKALAWLEKAYADRDGYLAWLKVEPAFDALRPDPKFQDLVRRMNFPQ